MNNIFFPFCITLLLISFLTTSCLHEDKIILKNDLESGKDGWSNWNIINDKGHSGSHYTKCDSTNNYSAGYSKVLSSLTNRPVRRIDLVAWIRKKDYDATANYVVSIEKGTETKFWNATRTNIACPEINEWTRLFASLDLSVPAASDETLKVFFWNPNKLPIEIDDFEIRLFLE